MFEKEKEESMGEESFKTAQLKVDAALFGEFSLLWARALDEEFERGFDSKFGDQLEKIIHQYGEPALESMWNFSHQENVNVVITGEAIRSIACTSDPKSKKPRFNILTKFLTHPSSIIRDQAALALDVLAGSDSSEFLTKALKKETDSTVRDTIKQILQSFAS